MTARIFNVIAGLWIFFSAFAWPHTSAELGYTAVCGALIALCSTLMGQFAWVRYLIAGTGVVLFVSAFGTSQWGSGTFWNNVLIGAAVVVAALMNGSSAATRRERDRYRCVGGP